MQGPATLNIPTRSYYFASITCPSLPDEHRAGCPFTCGDASKEVDRPECFAAEKGALELDDHPAGGVNEPALEKQWARLSLARLPVLRAAHVLLVPLLHQKRPVTQPACRLLDRKAIEAPACVCAAIRTNVIAFLTSGVRDAQADRSSLLFQCLLLRCSHDERSLEVADTESFVEEAVELTTTL